MAPSVFIIILNYRMRDQVADCLRSLRTLRYPDYRLIVVDNDSGDGLESLLRSEFPEVIFIQTGANEGYTGGNNRGLEYALAEGADYALILNPDTVVINPDFVSRMVEHLEASPQVGIAGPRVYLRQPGELQNTVLYAPRLWRNLQHWFLYRLRPTALIHSGDEVVEAEVLNGVCLLIRLACLREIGLFDEFYFMYIEDADMDCRARRAGWQIHYLPIESIVHRQKREGYQPNGPVDFLLKRNSFYYLVKQGRRREAIGFAFFALVVIWSRGLLTRKWQGLRAALDFGHRLVGAWRAIIRASARG
jgi:GT2 family glycosyltransferase